ncbi:MAG: CDP-alcohol phosphatidyltransferase family protein [Thermoplasmatota archaeon]
MKIKETLGSLNIPDYITLSNGLLGFLAITYIIDRKLHLASILLVICIGLDGLDGYLARRLNLVHELGSYLDVISDTLSFCFAPALLIYSSYYDLTLGGAWQSPVNALSTLVSMMVVFFGVLRLSRFVDIQQEDQIYTGLPTPLFTLLIACITYIFGWGEVYKVSSYIPLFVILSISFLLYSNLPYPKLIDSKRKSIGLLFLFLALIGFILNIWGINIGNIFIWITLFVCVLYVIFGPVLVDKYDQGKRRNCK